MRTLSKEMLAKMAEYINTYQGENHLSPSYRNIMHALDMSSLNLVQRYVLQLERDGKIHRTNLGNIQLPEKYDIGQNTIVPLIGSIACGEPCFSEERIEESFTLPAEIFGTGKLYMLRAFGDSMIDIGINEGDLLVIHQQEDAKDGEIVVAMVNGENTLKRLYHRNGKIVLHPENKTMKDIEVTNCEIQGVLVGCIKTY